MNTRVNDIISNGCDKLNVSVSNNQPDKDINGNNGIN